MFALYKEVYWYTVTLYTVQRGELSVFVGVLAGVQGGEGPG